MPRPGKIARLPETIREQVNQGLADGHASPAILTWLNELPQVRTILAQSFHGQPINSNNLIKWRNAGYQDWLHRRAALHQVQELARQSSGLVAANQTSIAEGAAALAAAGLFRALEASDPNADPARFARLVHALAALRQAEIAARWIGLEHHKSQRHEREIQLNERRVKVLEQKAALLLNPPATLGAGAGLTPETLARIEREAKLL